MSMKRFISKIFRETNKKAIKSNLQTGVIVEILDDGAYKVRIHGDDSFVTNIKPVNPNATFVVGQKVLVGNTYNKNEDWYIFGDSKAIFEDSFIDGDIEVDETRISSKEEDKTNYPQSTEEDVRSVYLNISRVLEWEDELTKTKFYRYGFVSHGNYQGGDVLVFVGNTYSTGSTLKNWALFEVLDGGGYFTLVPAVEFPTGTYYWVAVIYNDETKKILKKNLTISALQAQRVASQIYPVTFAAENPQLADYMTKNLYKFNNYNGYFLTKTFQKSLEGKIQSTYIHFDDNHKIQKQYFFTSKNQDGTVMPTNYEHREIYKSSSGEVYSICPRASVHYSNLGYINYGHHSFRAFNAGDKFALVSRLYYEKDTYEIFRFILGEESVDNYAEFSFLGGDISTFSHSKVKWEYVFEEDIPNDPTAHTVPHYTAETAVLEPDGVLYILGYKVANCSFPLSDYPQWEIFEISTDGKITHKHGLYSKKICEDLSDVSSRPVFLNEFTLYVGNKVTSDYEEDGTERRRKTHYFLLSPSGPKEGEIIEEREPGVDAYTCASWGPSQVKSKYMADFKKEYFYTPWDVWRGDCLCGCCFEVTKRYKNGEFEHVLYAEGKAFCGSAMYGWENHPAIGSFVADLLDYDYSNGDSTRPSGQVLLSFWNLKRFMVAQSGKGFYQGGDILLPVGEWPINMKFWDGQDNFTYFTKIKGVERIIKVRNGKIVLNVPHLTHPENNYKTYNYHAYSYRDYNPFEGDYTGAKAIAMSMKDVR